MSLNQFEDFLKDKSEGFSMEPDPLTWTGIEKNLPPEKRKRKAIFLWIPVIAACFLALWILVDPFTKNVHTPKSHQEPSAASGDAAPVHPQTPDTKDTFPTPVETLAGNLNPDTKNDNFQGSTTISHSPIESHPAGATDDDSRFAKTCKRSVLNFPFLNPSVEHSDPVNNQAIQDHIANSLIEKTEFKTEVVSEINNNIQAELDSSRNLRKDSSDKSNEKKNDKNTPVKNYQWFAFAEGMPHFTVSRISIESQYKNTEPYASDCKSRRNDDKGRINASFGLGFGIKIKDHHNISIGIRYLGISHSLTVYNVDNSVISGIPNRYSSFDYSSSDSFKSLNSFGGGGGGTSFPAGPVVNKYSYFGIPVTYGYSFNLGKKFGMGINLGMAYNLMHSQSGIAHQANSDIYIKSENGSVMSVRKTHFSGQLSLLLSYQFNTKSSLYLQVNGLRSLTPIEKDIVRTGYSSVGLGLGYAYFFGKKNSD